LIFADPPSTPVGSGDGSTLDILVFGISYHWPIASAFTQAGRVPGGGNAAPVVRAQV